MSEQNVPQQWKREPCDTNHGGNNFFTKADVAAAAAAVSAAVRSGGGGGEQSSSSSSFSSISRATTTNLSAAAELYQQQQQQQTPHQLQHNDLQKFTNITKINTLSKISGFEGVAQMPEDEKLRKVQQIVEAGVGDHAKQQILQILDKISLLKPPERLLLYLRMPGGTPETDPLRQPQNPLGTRSEINHTINWVRSHLEHDPKVSIPKQDVYNDYISYCERVDIKPLSTADFGKVMKQVFPEIRPRRLGTRGHSRYCYAAMRKSTKLDPPRLPDLGTQTKTSDFNGVMDEDSWKIIKMWAEGLLNATFDSLKDLSTHITRHHLNTPASNSSRLLLQKKLLQREAREKRKYAQDASPLKKRRKKKRRSSSSSESVLQQSTLLPDGALVNVKTEVLDSTTIQQQHQQQPQQQQQQQQQQQPTQIQPVVTILQAPQQMLPMNLVTEQDANNLHKIHGTNSGCDSNLVVGSTTKNIIAPNISTICATSSTTATGPLTPMPENLTKPPLIKEEISDEYNSNVLCKKVRQAHQAKGLWNPSQNPPVGPTPDSQAFLIPPDQTGGGIFNYPRVNDNLMRAPAHIELTPEHSANINIKLDSNSNMPTKPESQIMIRARKLRYMQAKLQSVREETGASEVDPEKDVLPENLGIPRERVISICNMDKHELDDYLNGEDNSQDQEAELLQYFQTGENGQKANGTVVQTGAGHVEGTSGPIPNPENYQGYNSNREDKRNAPQKDHDEITQLRYYLHQNLQNTKDGDPGLNPTSPLEQPIPYSNIYTAGSASASLAMMSQRHMSDDLRCCNNETGSNPCGGNNSALRGFRRKINLNARTSVPNSPNARRKNFSFVPISPNANTPNNSVDYSPFVSPRSTPVVRKPPLHKQQSLPLADQTMTDSMIGATRANYGKASNMNTISASAPVSPSLAQQRFHFAPTTSTAAISHTHSGGGDPQFNHFQSVAVQCRNQNSSDCNIDGTSAESRSQSVPLHCQSPVFNQAANFPGFSSACSSVAQTPVPPEFADFSDPSTILDIFSDTSQNPVKLETNDVSSSILDVDLTSNESAMGMSEILPTEFDPKINSVSSRSVPSTPLPMLNYKTKGVNSGNQDPNRMNKMYDISKSVPTTPIAMNVPFRYSPEFNRDFLINGNTIESSGISSFYSVQQQQQQHTPQQQQQQVPSSVAGNVIGRTVGGGGNGAGVVVVEPKTSAVAPTSLPEGIDDLSSFGDVTESIIGADLLGNL